MPHSSPPAVVDGLLNKSTEGNLERATGTEMGEFPYDYVENPLEAVQVTFEKAVQGLATDGRFDPARFYGKDWGVVDLFRHFVLDNGGFSKIPILEPSNLHRIRPNTLVRYRGMIQDMFGNELYIGAFKDGDNWRTNKFMDRPMFEMTPSPDVTQLWERCLVYCVPVPGQNSWTLESINSTSPYVEKRLRNNELDMMDFNDCDNLEKSSLPSFKKQRIDEVQIQNQSLDSVSNPHFQSKTNMMNGFDMDPFSCLVKVYDTPENNLNLNDVIEFVGIYTFDSEVAEDEDVDPNYPTFELMEDITDHIPPTKVPRLHCLIHRKLSVHDFLLGRQIAAPTPNLIRDVRESLFTYLSTVLGNDGLAAQCLLLHILSRVRSRDHSISVGRLSLNLSGLTRESASMFGNQLSESLKNILPFSQYIPLTVEYLNTDHLQPRKNNETGRLVSGALQLAQGTHLVIDETTLCSGTLCAIGVENVRLLKHLMEFQTVVYNFKYYNLEMPGDVQFLILSEGKSNILPADLVVPFQPNSTMSSSMNVTPELLESWRWYLAEMKSIPHSIEPHLQKTLEDDMVAARKDDVNLRCEDLSRLLTMAQLMSASFGEANLSLERWRMVKEIERLRKERIGGGI